MKDQTIERNRLIRLAGRAMIDGMDGSLARNHYPGGACMLLSDLLVSCGYSIGARHIRNIVCGHDQPVDPHLSETAGGSV